MKAIFEQVSTGPRTSFVYKYLELPAFDAPYHFHPAYELTWICEGKGVRYVGRSSETFSDGDMVFLGSNLPHCWINQDSMDRVSAHVIQFEEAFLGPEFFLVPEMEGVKRLFEKSKAGFSVVGGTKELVQKKVVQLQHADPIARIVLLLEILGILSQSNDVLPLDGVFLQLQGDMPETVRFNKVMSYLIAHFREEIKLEQIAEIAHLTPSSFCRYFKGMMNKTLSEVILEFRVKHACQLLANSELSISQVAFESGFQDLPYFNRKFKQMLGVNPKAFRKQGREGMGSHLES